MNKLTIISLPLLLTSFITFGVFAQSSGDVTVGVGAIQLRPKSDNGKLGHGTLPTTVDNDIKPSLTFEYFIFEHLGIELLTSMPLESDISIKGLGKVGNTKILAPTISLQYHFREQEIASPFIGAGLNYTTFLDESTRGALEGSRLSLEDSWGLALHAGIDFRVNKNSAIRIDMRWIDVDTNTRLNGESIGTVHVDPISYGAYYVIGF